MKSTYKKKQQIEKMQKRKIEELIKGNIPEWLIGTFIDKLKRLVEIARKVAKEELAMKFRENKNEIS